MKTFAQWVLALTRGYTKVTGKKPDKLAKLKINMEAGQKVRDQEKVIKVDFGKKKPWHEKKAGGGLAGMLGEPTYVDDNHRVPFKDAKSVEGPSMGPQNIYDIGFNSILEDVMSGSPKREYTEKDLENIWNILQGDQDMDIEDLMFRFGRVNPDKKSNLFFELGKDKAGIGWKKQFNEGGRVPLSFGGWLMKLLQKGSKAKPFNVKDFMDKREFILSLIGQGSKQKNKRILNEILEESGKIRKNPSFKFPDTDKIKKKIWEDITKDITKHAEGGRVPFKKGKLALLQGLGKIMDDFFPGTTKLGKRSKPYPEKVQEKMDLRKALADFQEREKAAKSKITSHAGDLEKAGEGRFTKAEVLRQMFENTIKQSKSANTKKRFTNFMKEIEGNPELANDPQVWNFFTGKLPKNQKLVVYGDDTVDFWRQSDFGPHNIKTTDKFMQKHPYLTREQAVKIQNMEPEDQIFEMKKIEALRKKSMHASGGLAGMLGE